MTPDSGSTLPPRRADPRPTRADLRAFEQLQATVLTRALADAKAWRTGYAMLAGGLGAFVGFIGTRLSGDTSTWWRIVLTILLGGGLLAVALALLLTVTIEGGRRAIGLNLRELVASYNSVEAYQVVEAAAALKRLDASKRVAAVGAALAFVGLLVTLWLPGPPADPAPKAPLSPATSCTSPAPTASNPPVPSTPPT